jgi:hypothetical protein
MGCKDQYNDDFYDDFDDMNDKKDYYPDSGFDIPPVVSPNPPAPLLFDSPSSVQEFWLIMKEIGKRKKWLTNMNFLVLDLDE